VFNTLIALPVSTIALLETPSIFRLRVGVETPDDPGVSEKFPEGCGTTKVVENSFSCRFSGADGKVLLIPALETVGVGGNRRRD